MIDAQEVHETLLNCFYDMAPPLDALPVDAIIAKGVRCNFLLDPAKVEWISRKSPAVPKIKGPKRRPTGPDKCRQRARERKARKGGGAT